MNWAKPGGGQYFGGMQRSLQAHTNPRRFVVQVHMVLVNRGGPGKESRQRAQLAVDAQPSPKVDASLGHSTIEGPEGLMAGQASFGPKGGWVGRQACWGSISGASGLAQ